MIKDSKKTLEQGSSLMIFPEGTRSVDTNLKQFKDGAFKLAIETKTAILPIVLNGTGTALPKKGLIFRGIHRITVHILDEIPWSEFQTKDIRSLSAMVHEIMDKELEQIKNRV
jgi:1-acyl-sn-glycerol-3-phosphate acyltransferase